MGHVVWKHLSGLLSLKIEVEIVGYIESDNGAELNRAFEYGMFLVSTWVQEISTAVP